jgi:glutamate racemase
MRGDKVDRDRVAAQIAPCFVEIDGCRTDIVVLACTHYPFLADIMAELAPWPVTWLDPSPAIARRVASVLEGRAVARDGGGVAVFTGDRHPPPALCRLLREKDVPLREAEAASGV